MKKYPEDLIKGVTQERYKKIKFKNKEKCFLERIVFKKNYPKDRINGVTQQRY